MLRFRMFVVACIFLIAIAPSGCSSSAPGGNAGQAPQAAASATTPAASAPAAEPAAPTLLPQACKLLTVKDAEDVLGPGATLKQDNESLCVLETPKPLGPSIDVRVGELSSTWDGGEMMMKFDKEAKTVAGIGDGAYTFGGGTIVFKKGNLEVSVITSAYTGTKSKFDAAKLIAERLLAAM
jgi:hypothetical protein